MRDGLCVGAVLVGFGLLGVGRPVCVCRWLPGGSAPTRRDPPASVLMGSRVVFAQRRARRAAGAFFPAGWGVGAGRVVLAPPGAFWWLGARGRLAGLVAGLVAGRRAGVVRSGLYFLLEDVQLTGQQSLTLTRAAACRLMGFRGLPRSLLELLLCGCKESGRVVTCA